MADRYTTPTLQLTVEGVDLQNCDVMLTLRQGRRILNVRHTAFERFVIDGDTAEIDVTLTQQQSGMFREGESVEVQLNYIDENGYRGDTSIATTSFGRNLHESVMRHA